MRLQLTGGTADAFVLEGDGTIAAAVSASSEFEARFSDDFSETVNGALASFKIKRASAST